MDGESTYRRRLKEGEPDEPTQIWIECANGVRIDCDITPLAPRAWVARPPAPYRMEPGDRCRIDRLPAGGSVQFADVLPPEDSPDSE